MLLSYYSIRSNMYLSIVFAFYCICKLSGQEVSSLSQPSNFDVTSNTDSISDSNKPSVLIIFSFFFWFFINDCIDFSTNSFIFYLRLLAVLSVHSHWLSSIVQFVWKFPLVALSNAYHVKNSSASAASQVSLYSVHSAGRNRSKHVLMVHSSVFLIEFAKGIINI